MAAKEKPTGLAVRRGGELEAAARTDQHAVVRAERGLEGHGCPPSLAEAAVQLTMRARRAGREGCGGAHSVDMRCVSVHFASDLPRQYCTIRLFVTASWTAS